MSSGHQQALLNMVNVLTDPLASSLFNTHPNDIGMFATCNDIEIREAILERLPEWRVFWDWACESSDRWKELVQVYAHFLRDGLPSSAVLTESNSVARVPDGLYTLIKDAVRVSLPRDPIQFPSSPTLSVESCISHSSKVKGQGMSPKKYHEVQRMTEYIGRLLLSLASQGVHVNHIVDIGSGQGYVTRALHRLPLSRIDTGVTGEQSQSNVKIFGPIHVLALDSSSDQTAGAERRAARTSEKEEGALLKTSLGTLSHHTARIHTDQGVNGDAEDADKEKDLIRVIDKWFHETSNEHSDDTDDGYPKEPQPILFVALHACGSLTPAILRSVVKAGKGRAGQPYSWYCAAAVVVGCCYNLLEDHDFILSNALQEHILSTNVPDFKFTPSHLQLAAQVPCQWFRDSESSAASILSLRKIIFRALLEAYTAKRAAADRSAGKRLGKLNNQAYRSFNTFLSAASMKLQLDLLSNADVEDDIEASPLANALAVLHTLRCILGTVVESLIVGDRYQWLLEHLQEVRAGGTGVRLVNLFDQAVDSGRNIAIVVAPADVQIERSD